MKLFLEKFVTFAMYDDGEGKIVQFKMVSSSQYFGYHAQSGYS